MDFDSEIGKHGTDLDSDGEGTQLAHQAAASGDISQLIKAIKQDPEVIQQKDSDGLTPLAHAIHNKHLNVVKRLIKVGADINGQDSKGRTYLALAAYQGWYDGVIYLLRKGARPTITDKTGRTPLHAATYDSDTRSLTAILKRLSVDRINATDNEKMTALHWAAFHDRPEHVRLLLHKGADPKLVDIDRKTALHWAAQNGSRGCCLLLTQHDDGGDLLQLTDSAGKTVMHLVAAAGNASVIQDLSAYNTNLLIAEDEDDRTPLHWAAATGHSACVKTLLGLGVCPDPLDVDGLSPLEYARQAGHKQCAQLLQSAMSPTSPSNKAGSKKNTLKGGSKTATKNSSPMKQGKSDSLSRLQDNGTKLPTVFVSKSPSSVVEKHSSVGDKHLIDINQNSAEVETLNAGVRSVTPDIIIGRRKKHKRNKHCRRKHAENGASPITADILPFTEEQMLRGGNSDIKSPYLSPLVDSPAVLSTGLSPQLGLSRGHDGSHSWKLRELSPLRVRTLSRSPYSHPVPTTVAQLRLDVARTPTPPPFTSIPMRKVLPDINTTTPELHRRGAHVRSGPRDSIHYPDVT